MQRGSPLHAAGARYASGGYSLAGDAQGVAGGAAKVLLHMLPAQYRFAVDFLSPPVRAPPAAAAAPKASPEAAVVPEAAPAAGAALPGPPPPAAAAEPPQSPSPPAPAPATGAVAPAEDSVQKGLFMGQARQRAVPSGPLSRIWHFGNLVAGLAVGSAAQSVRNAVSAPEERRSLLLSDANMDRMVNTVCRMRGAVLKLGQMLSIQDEAVLPPALLQVCLGRPVWCVGPAAQCNSGGGGGGGHKASVSDGLPLAAPIGLSPLLILTLCGPERVVVVSTEPPDDLSCLTSPRVGCPGDGRGGGFPHTETQRGRLWTA